MVADFNRKQRTIYAFSARNHYTLFTARLQFIPGRNSAPGGAKSARTRTCHSPDDVTYSYSPAIIAVLKLTFRGWVI